MNSCASIIAATLRVAPGAPTIAPEAAMRSAAHLPARTRSSRHVQGPAAAAHAMNRKEAVVHFCRRPSKALRHQHASGGFKQPSDSLRSSNLIGSAAPRPNAELSACLTSSSSRGTWCSEEAVVPCSRRPSKALRRFHASGGSRHPSNSSRSSNPPCSASSRPRAEVPACPMSSPVAQAKCRVDESRRIAQLGSMCLSYPRSAPGCTSRILG